MPAIKKPVRNLKKNNEFPSVTNQTTAEFVTAPSNELIKNNLTGEKRSAKEKKANTSVPAINPSITAYVTRLTAYRLNPRDSYNSGSTAFPTNQSDVPANCESTITGKTFLLVLVSINLFVLFSKIGDHETGHD